MWIMPSRGRAHNVRRFFVEWPKMESSTPGFLAVDVDDPMLAEYQAIALPDGWTLAVFPPMSMCQKTNATWELDKTQPWYGYVDDDCLPRTPRWDALLVEAAGSCGMAHCWDGIKNEALASQLVIGGDLVRELGWICMPGLQRIYGDDVLTAIGKKRGILRYLPDVKLEHLHWVNGKAPRDATYKVRTTLQDRAVYETWLAKGMPT